MFLNVNQNVIIYVGIYFRTSMIEFVGFPTEGPMHPGMEADNPPGGRDEASDGAARGSLYEYSFVKLYWYNLLRVCAWKS